MIFACDIDLLKAGQLKNAILHLLADADTSAAVLTQNGQVGFRQSDNRVAIKTQSGVRELAYTTDLNIAKVIYLQDDEPVLPLGELFENGTLWYSKADSRLRMFSQTTQGWSTIGLDQPTGIPTIEPYYTEEIYADGALTIYSNKLYQNQSGTDNTGAWNESDWTYIGATVSTAARGIHTITNAQIDASTIGSVTRSGSTYTVVHGLDVSQAFVSIKKSATGEIIDAGIVIIDSNTIEVNFNMSGSPVPYDVSVAIM